MQQLKDRKSFQNNLHWFLFAFFITSRLAAIFLSYRSVTDILLYLKYMIMGNVFDLSAYKTFSFEYPPLALAAIYFPFLIIHDFDFESYFVAFACLMMLIDLLTLKLCQSYANFSIKDRNYFLFLYSVFGLMLFKLLSPRLDIVVAMFLILSILMFYKNRYTFFATIISGFFYKIIPVFIAPIGIMFECFNKTKTNKNFIKKLITSGIIFAIILTTLIFFVEVNSNYNFIKNMLYHQERGIQIESLYGSILMMCNLIFHSNFQVIFNFGAFHLIANPMIDFIARYLWLVILSAFYLTIFILLLKRKSNLTKDLFFEASFLTILILLLFQRVFSTQFVIWIIPLLAIYLTQKRSIYLSSLSYLFYFFTALIFSINYYLLTLGNEILVCFLFLRNLILVIMTYQVGKSFFKNLS